jgi:hypothetical protein
MKFTLITNQGQGRSRWPCLNNITGGVICYIYVTRIALNNSIYPNRI